MKSVACVIKKFQLITWGGLKPATAIGLVHAKHPGQTEATTMH